MENKEILIQLTRAYRLLKSEKYNNKILEPMKKVINSLREEMKVQRVVTRLGHEKIEYGENITN